MNINRRELLRRLAGLGTAVAAWASIRFVLDDPAPRLSQSFAAGGRPIRAAANSFSAELTSSDSTTAGHEGHDLDSTSATSSSTSDPAVDTTDSSHHEETTTPTPAAASAELVGPVGPILISAGSVVRIVGDVALQGDLIVEGVLTGVDRFTLEGNGFQILVQNGGQLDLSGVPKSGWVTVEAPSEWNAGDRVAVAPTDPGVYDVTIASWPAHAGTYNLSDGRAMSGEIANLDRTIILRNLKRVMFHQGAGAQQLRWLSVQSSGVAGTLGFYPIHFHVLGNSARGSLVEGVVVEGGKHHAFVPHGSHGITFKDCVAYATQRDPFWWDPIDSAGAVGGGLDASHDVTYDHCLALGVSSDHNITAGFRLASGTGNTAIGCHTVAMSGSRDSTGFHWRHDSSVWRFEDCVSHNNPWYGFSVWQNTEAVHPLDRLVAYNCGTAEYEHGAYGNLYHYRDIYGDKFRLHAKSEKGEETLTIERANLKLLEVTKHQLGRNRPTVVKNSTITTVLYNEYEGTPSTVEYRDCSLTPTNFVFTAINPESIIEIYQGDVLTQRWAAGAWS